MSRTPQLFDTVSPEVWQLGHDNLVNAVFSPECDNLSVKDIKRHIGVYACSDGLCDYVCTHSLDEITKRYGLAYGTDYDYVDGVNAAVNELGLESSDV